MSENLLPFGFYFNEDNDLRIIEIDKRIKEEFNDCSRMPFKSSNNIEIEFLGNRLHLYTNNGEYIDRNDKIIAIHFPIDITEGTHNHFTSQSLSRSQRESLEIVLTEFQQYLLKELNKCELNPCVEIAETYQKFKRPIIGLKPRNIHESLRVQEICEAIIRYKNSDKAVPEEWIEELSDLVI